MWVVGLRRTPGRYTIDSTRKLIRHEVGAIATDLRSGAVTMAGTLGILWGVSIVNWLVFGGGLNAYAIAPLSLSGLTGIAIAPFLHGGLGHLLANSIAFVLLAPMMFLRKRMDFWVVSVLGALSSGAVVWLIGGAGTVHLGFSGVIFAYLGFLMTRGIWERSWTTIALSLGVTWFFGSMVWGVFPILAGAGISWQGHLGGFLGGILAARLLGRGIAEKGKKVQVIS